MKEPILRHHVAQRDDGVVVVFGKDMRHPPLVAHDGDGGLESVERQHLGRRVLGMASGAVEPIEGIEQLARRAQSRKGPLQAGQEYKSHHPPEHEQEHLPTGMERGVHG